MTRHEIAAAKLVAEWEPQWKYPLAGCARGELVQLIADALAVESKRQVKECA